MRYGRPRPTAKAKHGVGLQSGTIILIYFVPYRAGLILRGFKRSNVYDMLAINVIELALIALVRTVVFVTRKERTVKFYVVYR